MKESKNKPVYIYDMFKKDKKFGRRNKDKTLNDILTAYREDSSDYIPMVFELKKKYKKPISIPEEALKPIKIIKAKVDDIVKYIHVGKLESGFKITKEMEMELDRDGYVIYTIEKGCGFFTSANVVNGSKEFNKILDDFYYFMSSLGYVYTGNNDYTEEELAEMDRQEEKGRDGY